MALSVKQFAFFTSVTVWRQTVQWAAQKSHLLAPGEFADARTSVRPNREATESTTREGGRLNAIWYKTDRFGKMLKKSEYNKGYF